MESKRPCILQGPSGVGKSHLIKLLAKLLGKKIYIINLNKENGISILSKRYIFKFFEIEEVEKIETIVDEILEDFSDTKSFRLEEKIKKLVESKLEGNKKKKFEELKKKYNFTQRFRYEKSDFLKSLENGEWVLLDGL